MRRNKLTRLLALVLGMTMLLSLAACQSKETNEDSGKKEENQGGQTEDDNTGDDGNTGEETLEPMDLTLYLWGDKPNQMDEVLAEFEARTKDDLNIHLDINWAPQSDYANNIKLKLGAGEAVDFCFDAPWMNMNTFITQGNYRDLTPYFLNDEYPGLKAAFSEEFLSTNYMGENADTIYGIPLTQSYAGSNIVFIRGDLREKYGLDPVTDLESFEAYLQAVEENESSMIPFAMKNDGTYGAAAVIEYQDPENKIGRVEAGLWDLAVAPGITATLYVEDYEVKEIALSGEPASAKEAFPEPYNKANNTYLNAVSEWYQKGYIEKDVITRDDAQALFTSGKAASFCWDTAQYNTVESSLLASVEGAKLETWVIDPLVGNGIKGMTEGAFTAWNFICIPVTTSDEKTDRIMKFFDWIFSSTENHDLFEFGIEGKNFVAVGEDEYTYPEGIDLTTNYNFPGYMLTWNPNFIRYAQGYPEEVLAFLKNVNNAEMYYDPLLSGFTFNGDPVKNELANPDFQVIQTRMNNLSLGIYSDIEGEQAAIEAEVEGNTVLQEDIEAIKAEILKQVEPYLQERKALDEARGTVYPTVEALNAELNK